MENINNFNSINNIKITVEYDKLEDLELARALETVKTAKNDYEYTKSLYEPVMESMAEKKWDIIREQLATLVKIMKEGDINLLNATYISDETGNPIRIRLNHKFLYIDDLNVPVVRPFEKDDLFFAVGTRGSGFITRWQEYGIAAKLRKNLVYQLEQKAENYQKASNEVKDHFADVRDHN